MTPSLTLNVDVRQDETPLVTKAEALGMVTRFIERPGVMDLPVFMELQAWQSKLKGWLLEERK